MTIYREQIGQTIARLRKEAGLSQRDLAQKAGVTHCTINKVENAKFSAGVDVLGKIAEALGKRLDLV